MKKVDYAIVGGGMAAAAAVEGIRSQDKDGTVALFTKEEFPPYKKPPLSKGLWFGKPKEKIWFNIEKHQVELLLNSAVTGLDPINKTITTINGEFYSYRKLLLATGGSPRKLTFSPEDPRVIYYHSLDDYERLRSFIETSGSIGVVGGGFIGSEITAALTKNGKNVTMIFPEDGIGARLFPGKLSDFLTNLYRSRGIQVYTNSTVSSIDSLEKHLLVKTDKNDVFQFDALIVGIGLEPNVDLAKMAALKIENGIVVDDHLKTSQGDIYAAGDVIHFYNSQVQKFIRVEHEDHALTSGKVAGANMAGQQLVYTHLPMFYSDLFEYGYEAVGDLSSTYPTVQSWDRDFNQGLVIYHDNNLIKGILLWNIWEKIDKARNLIGVPTSEIPEIQKELNS